MSARLSDPTPKDQRGGPGVETPESTTAPPPFLKSIALNSAFLLALLVVAAIAAFFLGVFILF